MPAAAATPTAPDLRFGRFELQPRERRLLVDGQPAPLGGRALDMLVVLAERAQHLVTKDELLDRVWPGLVVEESNLHVQISSLRKVLGGELIATIPGRGYRLNAEPQPVVPPSPAAGAPVAVPAAAPAPTAAAAAGPRLIGRGEDLEQLAAALARPGCVSLVGAAGVGKTRLAQAAAAGWAGPTRWVDLAALTDGTQVPGALARALGVPLPEGDPVPVLVRELRDASLLLVLDNAEHVVAAVAEWVDRLLQAAPGPRWLVTSQLPLAISAERVLRLEPLALPGTRSDEEALADGALALLVDRIVAAQRRFRVDTQSLPLLRRLCTRLDGLPLALEMAATRVPLLGLKGVCDALGERFSLLTAGRRTAPGRHRTLHAALDWSHGLLSPDEQRLFRTLGVFAGGFTIDLAVAAAGEDGADRWETVDRLATLVDRSMVAADHEALPRYRLLETMRAYALEKLAAAGEEAAVRARVGRALLQLFRASSIPGAGKPATFLPELDNVRETLAWARQEDPALAVELSTSVARLTAFTPWRNEALAWLFACEPLLATPFADRLEPAVLATWWAEFARGLIIRMNPRATEAARRACELARRPGLEVQLHAALVALVRTLPPGDELDAACSELQALLAAREWPLRAHLSAQGAIALAHAHRDDLPQALAARRLELDLARRCGLPNVVEATETNIVGLLVALGRLEEALSMARRLVEQTRASRSTNEPWAWEGLLSALIGLGRLDEAQEVVAGAMAANQRLDLPTLGGLEALLAARRRRPRIAARLVGHGREAYRSRSMAPSDLVRRHFDEAEREARGALGDETFAALAAEGGQLDDPAAAAWATRSEDG